MGSETFQKREREKKRQERVAQRQERREARRNADDEPVNAEPVSTEALMEQFRVLSERHASGAVDAATYERERAAIYDQLGVNDPFAG